MVSVSPILTGAICRPHPLFRALASPGAHMPFRLHRRRCPMSYLRHLFRLLAACNRLGGVMKLRGHFYSAATATQSRPGSDRLAESAGVAAILKGRPGRLWRELHRNLGWAVQIRTGDRDPTASLR